MAAPIPHTYCFDYSTEEISNTFNTNMVPFLNYDINSPVSVASFPEPFGVNSDCMLVPQLPDYTQNQEECRGSMSFSPAYNFNPMPAENWGLQEAMTNVEETDQVKVEKYSVEERKDRILRYLKKRNQRNFNKTIKYACRKTLADKRVRVRGRFAKNESCSQVETLINTINDNCDQQNNSFHDDFYQMMKYDEDYWFEAAMANLGQLPYLGN